MVSSSKLPPLRFLSPIHKASRRITSYLERRLAEISLTSAEGHLLSYLTSYAPCPVGQLSTVFGHRGSTLTSILDRLDRRGLVRREVNPDDRRSFLVHVTPAGRGVGRKIRRHLEQLEDSIADRLKPAEMAGFRAVMASIEQVTAAETTKESES